MPNTALATAVAGLSPEEAQADRTFNGRSANGRLVESAVAAHLANVAWRGDCELCDWRETNREVDVVMRAGKPLLAIEVESGRRRDGNSGLDALRALIEKAEGSASADGLLLDEASLRIGPCVPAPGKILCVGLNYLRHALESGLDAPEAPVLFSKFANTVAGPGEGVPLRPWRWSTTTKPSWSP